MFPNTLDITVLGSARTLARVNQDKFSSNYRYRSAALNLDLAIRHTDRPTPGKVGIKTERHNVEMTATVFSTVDGVLVSTVSKAYFVFELETGAAATAAHDMLDGILAVFSTDDDKFASLVNWES